MKRLVTIFALSFFGVSAFGQWQWVNPSPCGDEMLSVDCSDENFCLAVAGGAVYKTTDLGATWEVVYAGDGYLKQIEIVNANTAYVVGNLNKDGIVLKTTDGGNNWVQQTIPSTSNFFGSKLRKVQFIDENIGFAGGFYHNKMLLTTDGGINWIESDSAVSNLRSFHFMDANTGIYSGQKGTYISTDGGKSWDQVSGDDFPAVALLDANTVIGCGDFGCNKSTDGGKTWSPVSGTANASNFSLVDGNTIYGVSQYYNKIYKTSDAGDNWSEAGTTPGGGPLAVKMFDTGKGIVVGNALAGSTSDDWLTYNDNTSAMIDKGTGGTFKLTKVQFVNSTTGFITGIGIDSLYKSTDGGATWFPVSAYIGELMDFPDENTGYSAITWDGEVYKTTDGGDSWTNVTGTIDENPAVIQFLDASTGFVGSENGSIFKTTDGGQNWTKLTVSAGYELKAMFFPTIDTGFVSAVFGGNKKTFRTVDGGATWEDITYASFSTLTAAPEDLYFTSSQVGFAAYKSISNDYIYKTTDGGNTWTSVMNSTEEQGDYFWDIEFLDDSTGFAVGYSGMVYRTTDGGDSWENLETGTTTLFGSVGVIDAQTVVIVGRENSLPVLRTTNAGGSIGGGGNSAPSAPTNLTVTPLKIVASDIKLDWTDNSNNEDGFKIERGTDVISFNIIDSVAADVVTYTDQGLTDGETFYYRVFAYNQYGSSSYSNEVSATAAVTGIAGNTLTTISIRPNPSNGIFSIDSREEVNTEIFDIVGNLVWEKTVTGTEMIDLSDLSEGIYLIRLTNNQQSISKKIIVK